MPSIGLINIDVHVQTAKRQLPNGRRKQRHDYLVVCYQQKIAHWVRQTKITVSQHIGCFIVPLYHLIKYG